MHQNWNSTGSAISLRRTRAPCSGATSRDPCRRPLTSLVTIPSGLKYANFTSMSAFSLTHEVLNASDKEIWPTSCVDVSRQNLSCLCFLFFSFGGSSNADVFRSSRWLCANRQRPPSAPQRPWRNRGHNEVFIKSGRSWRSSSPWAIWTGRTAMPTTFLLLEKSADFSLAHLGANTSFRSK